MKYLLRIMGGSKSMLFLLTLAIFTPWNVNAQKALPYSYGFENNDLTAEGWTKTTGSINSNAAHEGSYGFRFTYSGGYLMSPLLTGTDNGVELNFYYTENTTSWGDGQFQVGYSTDESTTDPSAFTYGERVYVSSTSWIRYEASFPEGTKYVAIKRVANYGDNIYMDDFSFAAPSSCPNPTNLQASLAGSNGNNATLSWTENGTATNWVLEYGTASDFTDATSVDVSDTPTHALTNLRPLTTYYARVKADCGGGDQSVWSDTREFTMPVATLLVNNGDGYSSVVPFCGNYVNYGAYSQFILPAESLEIMVGGTIDKLTFYSNSNVNLGNAMFNVYMAEVENEVFESADFAEWSAMTQVYNGYLDISGYKMTITLSEPFFYQGNNLMIGFEETAMGTSRSVSWYGVIGDDNTALAGYKTSSAGNLQMYLSKFLPKMTFDYTESDYLRVAFIEQGDITATTAQFSWTAPSSEVTGYEYQYWRSSETWPDAWTPINATTVTLNDLSPVTEYKFRVRAVYGEHQSAPHTVDFQTVCLEYAYIPFFEDFNSYTNFVNFTTNYLPPCWNYINTSTSSFSGCPLVWYNNSDDRYLFFNCSAINSPQDQYAILPPMENLAELRITFYARLRLSNMPSSIIVGVMSDPEDATTFVPISSTGDLTMNNKKFKVKLEDVADDYHYIAFMMEAATTQQKQAIVDNVTVEPIPPCEEPDDLTVEATTGHAVTLSWTDAFTTDAWQVYVSTESVIPDDLVATNLYDVTSNPCTITGLVPETDYYAWVRSSCGAPDVYSPWMDPVSFTTDIACPKPNNLSADEVDAFTTTVSWEAGGDEDTWRLQIASYDASTGEWNDYGVVPEPVITTTYTFNDLTPETSYRVQVKAICGGDDGESVWTNPLQFTTAEACPKPYYLYCNSIKHTSARAVWHGTSQSYQVRYWRDPIMGNPIFEEYFNNGIGDWTMQECNSETGVYNEQFYFNYNDYYTQYLISPEISASNSKDDDGFLVEFKYHNSESYYDIFYFGYSPTSDLDDFTWNEIYYDNETGWEKDKSRQLRSGVERYSGMVPANTNYIAFMYDGEGGLCIDNIVIGAPDIDPGQTVTVTETSAILSNLIPSTGYHFTVKGFCEGGWESEESAVQDFSTRYEDRQFVGTINDDWHEADNWQPVGVPDTDDEITLIANATIYSGIAYASFIDENNHTLTINDGAQLVTFATVPATVKKEIIGYSDGGGWNFIATPFRTGWQGVAPTNINNLVNLDYPNDYDLYRFVQCPLVVNGAGKEWENYKAHTEGFKLYDGVGNLYASKNTVMLSYTGDIIPDDSQDEVPTNGVIWLEYESEQPDHDMTFRGWNLIGNPFTFNTNVDRSFYRMNAAGTAIEAVSEYWNPENYIAPCTGIMVEAWDVDDFVTFSLSGINQQNSMGSLNIALAQANARDMVVMDNAIISFDKGSELSKFYFGNSNANIYIPSNNNDYAIVYSEGMGELPLNFKANENGSYTLSFNNDKIMFNYLHLVDNMNGIDVNLLQTPSYTFDASITDYESRFKLVFVASGEADDDHGFAFFSNGNFIINNEGNSTLQVVDVNGRILKNERISGSTSINMDVAPGVYLFRLINGDNVKVQKLVVR